MFEKREGREVCAQAVGIDRVYLIRLQFRLRTAGGYGGMGGSSFVWGSGGSLAVFTA